jgi:hypothetical protein
MKFARHFLGTFAGGNAFMGFANFAEHLYTLTRNTPFCIKP